MPDLLNPDSLQFHPYCFVCHNTDAQCLPEMLAMAWAVSEEIDKQFINYKM